MKTIKDLQLICVDMHMECIGRTYRDNNTFWLAVLMTAIAYDMIEEGLY